MLSQRQLCGCCWRIWNLAVSFATVTLQLQPLFFSRYVLADFDSWKSPSTLRSTALELQLCGCGRSISSLVVAFETVTLRSQPLFLPAVSLRTMTVGKPLWRSSHYQLFINRALIWYLKFTRNYYNTPRVEATTNSPIEAATFTNRLSFYNSFYSSFDSTKYSLNLTRIIFK